MSRKKRTKRKFEDFFIVDDTEVILANCEIVEKKKVSRSIGNRDKAIRSEVISVIGLGYVGLPVAIGFSRKYRTIGYDIKADRIAELLKCVDRTGEVSSEDLCRPNLQFTSDPELLKAATFHIVTVPTPIDEMKHPNLESLTHATKTVGSVLKVGDMVVYESTVYPGLTEEKCIPLLEQISGLRSGVDFLVGYSPERINPGDKAHSFTEIKKVVSGQSAEALDRIAEVYGEVVDAGVFRAKSIKVAEAAKVIENTQRDLNVALINELSLIFHRLGISTHDVLEAAGTKWNFLDFRPGLVGGHCIGIDPYYLTHKAEEVGYMPQVILAGRRVNDGMGAFVAEELIKKLAKKGVTLNAAVVSILGITFKENCPDIRNSKVLDIIGELEDYGIRVQVTDSRANLLEVKDEYGIELVEIDRMDSAHALIVAVRHEEYRSLSPRDFRRLSIGTPIVMDVKGIYSAEEMWKEGIVHWRL